jgi:hypothetical protein
MLYCHFASRRDPLRPSIAGCPLVSMMGGDPGS